MEVVITKSKTLPKRNTMPGLMVLKLLALVIRHIKITQNIKIKIEKKDT